MRRDSTTQPGAPTARPRQVSPGMALGVRLLGAALLGALLVTLAYQIPAAHIVDIGANDSGYVQGFGEPTENNGATVRPLSGTAFLLFPQIGLPAELSLRMRADLPTNVAVLLNNRISLGEINVGPEWAEQRFTISGGVDKPEDVLIAVQGAAPDPAVRLGAIWLDRATLRTSGWPIVPYPSQILFGALIGAALALLDRGWRGGQRRLRTMLRWGVPALLIVLFLVFYRLQPPLLYPFRGMLPLTMLALLAALTLQRGPALARRFPALLDVTALGGVAAWTVALLRIAQNHVVLSLPGVENDFRVFALRSARLVGQWPAGTRSADLDGVLRADGFYNLGYPLLLWLLRPLTQDNPFLAGRVVAALSATVLMLATWWLARRLFGRGVALLAEGLLLFSPLLIEGGLYLGTDMPFAALCACALAALVAGIGKPQRCEGHGEQGTGDERQGAESAGSLSFILYPSSFISAPSSFLLAGLLAGAAFLLRHPGLLLWPLGLLAIALLAGRGFWRVRWAQRAALWFTLGVALAIAPQLAVNLRDTGQPFYNQQAENVWLAVYAGGDWGRSGEVPPSVSVGDIARRDLARLLVNWANNLRGFLGTGGEDTSEFGRALQLRMLGFPANWLAIAGLLGWIFVLWQNRPDLGISATAKPTNVAVHNDGGETTATRSFFPILVLLLWLVLYVIAVSIGLPLQGRFVLPLLPVYALAAAWLVGRLANSRALLAAGMLLLVMLWGNIGVGSGYVLGNQDADRVAAVRLVAATLGGDERLATQLQAGDSLGKYSAIAHLVVPPDQAQYLLVSGDGAGEVVGRAGRYTLLRNTP